MYRNIPEITHRIKEALAGDLFLVLLITFVGFFSFGLGRLSVDGNEKVPIRIIEPVAHKTLLRESRLGKTTLVDIPEGGFVSSKNGTKYHLPWCSGARRIKKENKIWFATRAAAEKAGYTPAVNCPGL